MQSALKILFLDDHASLRDGLELLLSKRNQHFSFFSASNVEEAAKIISDSPDISLAVVDLNLDGEDGLFAVKSLRTKKPELPIIIYSMYADSRHIEKALQIQVQGYVTKNDGTDELESAIKIVSAGGLCYSEAAANVVKGRLFGENRRKSEPASYENYLALSKSEQEVFALLAEKKHPSEIAKILGKKEKTVINQRTMIYQKLNLKDLFELVEYARTLGVIV